MAALEAEIAKQGATRKDIIEQTDIGGPTMLRAAAKGRRIVLSAAEQRQQVIEWLKAGKPDEEAFLEELAARAEYEAARYTMTSALYLGGTGVSGFIAKKHSSTKYGENPQQAEAGLYADNRINVDPLGIDQFEHVKGWQESFVNHTDVDRCLQTITHIAAAFQQQTGTTPPIVLGVKHGNACGTSMSIAKNHAQATKKILENIAEDYVEATEKMIEGDTRAIFGGVVMINGIINEEIADTLMHYAMAIDDKNRMLDGVVGAGVTDEALEILSRSKLRVITNPALGQLDTDSLDTKRRIRPVRSGVLEQPNYTFVLDFSKHVEEHGELTDQQRDDMLLAWAIGATSDSNTITLVKDGKLIGNGAGSQDRVGAAQLAISRTSIELPTLSEEEGKLMMHVPLDKEKLEGAVAYSDSFFPFPDGPQLLADAGIKAILTSSGSVNDQLVLDTLRKADVSVAMVPDKIARGFFDH